jgi:glutamate-1-semialdehyde aminotransferase/malonyl CoA-acyl carrier protein transacylase/non-ribosomal peptide synthetase component F
MNNNIAFLFTGQGSIYPGMAKELYESLPVFKEELDHCDRLFSRYINQSITRLLYEDHTGGQELNQPIYAQPIIFSIGYCLCKLWESRGITPSLVIGHSIGEYAAACIAGVFSLEQAVKLVAVRGKIMHQVPGNGKMVGVLMSEAKARDMISPYTDSVSIAAVNGPQNITLSGNQKNLDKIIQQIKQNRVFVEPLDISHPFHSIQMEPYVEKFKKEINGIAFSNPKVPIISTITGKIARDEMNHADYWCTHIRKTVRFYDAVKTAEEQGMRVFVEIGGTTTLCALASDCVTNKDAIFIPSLRKGHDAREQISKSLSRLYPQGINIMDIHHKKNKDEEIQWVLKHFLEVIAGLDPGNIDQHAGLFSMGIDSFMLVQLRKKIGEKYNIDITLNDFFTKYTSIEKISSFIAAPHDCVRADTPRRMKTNINELAQHIGSPRRGDADIETVLVKQLEIIRKLNQKVSGIMEKQVKILKKSMAMKTSHLDHPAPAKHSFQNMRFLKLEADELTQEQETFIEKLTARYTFKTQKSKTYAQDYRRELTDWINSLNFRMSLKELIYPIVSQRSRGARFWDIDGNEYIDIGNGFGANYFGHRPGFIVQALEKQIKKGFELATQSELAGKVARLISRLANVERVVFSNTGTEAVMTAIRIARAVTGRNKIVRFAGSFHGTFDGVLAEADETGNYTMPISPGTPPTMVKDTIVLVYGAQESLEKIESMGEELAAVLVEPVQSRRPGFQPREFLHRLLEITNRTGAAFILDDIYMGFRIHQGGSQAYFDIEADIVTFGKVIGGGMPIGIVAGKTKFLDAIDGGYWDYGDDSCPGVQLTFFGGTFCRHPLTMAAAYAALKHMEEQGPGLQENLNKKAQHLVNSVNRFFEKEHVPIRMRNFGSMFRFESFGTYDLVFQPIEMDLFFYLLMEKGVYVWERRICCLSTAHTDEDIKYVIKAVKDSIKELRQGGFSFSSLPGDLSENRKPYGTLLPAQQRYFILNQIKELEKAAHLSMAVTISGQLDAGKLERAMQKVIERHDVCRMGFRLKHGESEMVQEIQDTVEFKILYKKAPADKMDETMAELLQPFDLAKPPLIRMGVVEFSKDDFLLVLDTHHIITDGDSANILIQELSRLYQGKELSPLGIRYKDYLNWWQDYLASPTFKTHEQFWLEKLSGSLPQLDLPVDFSRPKKKNYQGGLVKFRLPGDTARTLKNLAKNCDATLFMVLLTSYYILLHKLSGQEDMIVGIPVSIRGEKEFDTLVGYLTNNLVLPARPAADKTFTAFLKEIKNDWFEAYLHKEYPYEMLVEKLQLKRDLSRNPIFDAMFIYENVNERVFKIENLECNLYYFDAKVSVYDLTLEVSESENDLDIKLYYTSGLFKKESVETWKDYFLQVLKDLLNDPDIHIKDILPDLKKTKPPVIEQAGETGDGREKQKKIQAPANEIERKLIEIWEQELNIRGIGAADNFFEIGGRSFDTIRTLSRINSQLGVRVSLTALFAYPTVSELALQVKKFLAKNTIDEPGIIPPAPSRSAYDLSHEQMRYWLNTIRALPEGVQEAPGVEITVDVIILEGRFHFNRLKQALAELFKRHDILRTTYDQLEGKPVQIIHQAANMNTNTNIPIEYCDLSGYTPGQREEQLSKRLSEEYNRGFNLKTGPLIRFIVYKIHESRHILFCSGTHISFDGWSFSVIMEETAYFYNALKPGGTISPLPPVLRYVDYVEWHEKRLASGELDRQANYWTEYLTKKIPVAHLPYDYPEEGAGADIEPSKIFRLTLNPGLTAKLHETASRENTTLFVTMLAVLNTWIASLSNQTMITVGTIFSGRTHPELEKIPGIMMNLLPMRLDLSGNPDCREILSRTRQVVLDTYDNQDYPLDLVAHRLRQVINLNRDIYSIMFIGQETIEKVLHFDGLEASSRPLLNLIAPRENKDDGFLEWDYDLQQDLLIEMFEKEDDIVFLIRYNNRRFRSQTVKQNFDLFESIAERFLEISNLRLSQLQSLKRCELDELF